MRIFNRIVIILLLAGLFVLGVLAVLYSLGVAGYRLAELPLDTFSQDLIRAVRNVETGNLHVLDLGGLLLSALLGLVLLVFELKPPAPHRVRMQQGTYITRRAVENEAIEAVESPEVLQSSVNVEAQRRPGAKVNVKASIRRGEDVGSTQSGVQDRVQRRLSQVGIPVSNLKVRLVESDPRETRARVR
ncbi:MAG TPA: hypothetical protein VHF46_01225 [Rubrobacteraceae bacterium]|nr:hypothetical protein [Rubrobacteraceae bacterium]